MAKKSYYIDEKRLPADANLDRLVRYLDSERDSERGNQARLRKSFETLQRKYIRLQEEILGAETIQKLQQYRLQNELPQLSELRYLTPAEQLRERKQRLDQSLVFAKRLNVNLDSLNRLHKQAEAEIKSLLPKPDAELGEIELKKLGQEPDFSPLNLKNPIKPRITTKPLQPFGGGVNLPQSPPYAWWDRGSLWIITGEGKLLRNDSLLNGDWGQSGSCVWVRNKNASDHDVIFGSHSTGFLIPYTPQKAGKIRLQFHVKCLYAEHCINAYNEWGWSSYSSYARDSIEVGAIWNWEDDKVFAMSNVFLATTVGAGNGDSSP
ncbi:hypothetical protein [Larkinella terrae]|uniref:Uncharacterized protein n=2 Tax=Larkinella terrae TaxID=2025311 RepID=A0A7K0EDN9_9BACT|nr:hypothetical protein [Larkinella terrae]